jgi:predicted transglutaminase-like cysteine proteinase
MGNRIAQPAWPASFNTNPAAFGCPTGSSVHGFFKSFSRVFLLTTLLASLEGNLVLADTRVEPLVMGVSAESTMRMSHYRQFLSTTKGLPVSHQIMAVNSYFNEHIAYESDRQVWGKGDYWATPLETLSKGAGDCEDFAIAKYYSLLRLGVAVEQLKITFVKSTMFTQAHMVLFFYPEGEADPLILDNLMGRVERVSHRTDLMPVYSFNDQGLFLPPSTVLIGSPGRLSKWKDVINRMEAEGKLMAAEEDAINQHRI